MPKLLQARPAHDDDEARQVLCGAAMASTGLTANHISMTLQTTRG